MKSKANGLVKYGVNWLLLAVNSIGITGAALEALEIPWRKLPSWDIVLLFGALVVSCGIGAMFRLERSGKKSLAVLCCFAVLYLFLGLYWREELAEGARLALKNAVENLNGRYRFHIIWQTSAVSPGQGGEGAMLFAILYTLLFLEVLAGFAGRYDRVFCLILGNGLWLTAACACDIFPGYFFLTLCVLGAAGTLTQRDFGENPLAGAVAAAGAMVLAGAVMAFSYSVLLPVLDEQYEIIEGSRGNFYRIVNEDWIPKVRRMLPGGGFGPGMDVTGKLGRSDFLAYTGADTYRVTVDRKPQGSLYLKGFVGGTYVGAAWEDVPDRDIEDYYDNAGMELPKHYSELVNIGYEAAGALASWVDPGYISIEELGGQGSYMIYPYGAYLSETERVYGDGSAERRTSAYGFTYYYLSGFNRGQILPAKVRKTEEQYRQYVYDSFLEYPWELTGLTEALEQADIRTDSVYHCIMDLMNYLDGAAQYDLDAGNPPPGSDFVEYFLTESHRGYCMHFASAAVLSLRYFGIPARYATGYTVSASDFSEDDDGKYTAVLTGRQAHAWAEIYLDSVGWTPVEMTPGAVAFPEDNRMEMAAQIRQLTGEDLIMAGNEDAWQTDKTQWQQESEEAEEMQFGSGEQLPEREEILSREDTLSGQGDEKENFPGMPSKTGEEESAKESSGLQESQGKLFGILIGTGSAAVLAVVFLLYRRRQWRRAESFRQAPARDRIFVLYRKLRYVLSLAGCPKGLAADEAPFFRILEEQFSVSKEEYAYFCNILERNSFGREEPSEEEFQAVYTLCYRLVKSAWKKAPFYKRMLIRELARSM